MFSDQYEFFINDFEKKLKLVTEQEGVKLISSDFESFIMDLFDNLRRCIDFEEIDKRLDELQKIDIEAIIKAESLFNRQEFFDVAISLADDKQIKFKEVFDYLHNTLETIRASEYNLGRAEVSLRLEWVANTAFEQMIYILKDKAPIQNLQNMIKGKLDILSDNDIRILWSYIKEEFREKPYGFEYDKGILGNKFFEASDIKELRKNILLYVTVYRPQIVEKALMQGKAGTPIFAFGIARILALTTHYSRALSFQELIIIRIIARILTFWKDVCYGNKDELCSHLGISSEGRIASITPRDLDNDFGNSWFNFKADKIKSYRIILYELRRLLEIANYYITRQTNLEKALFQYKLINEIFSKENNKKFKSKIAPNELALQKELCAFLLERDIYSYGKSFGTAEIDLMVDQPGETFVIETKIYKMGSSLDRHITQNVIQLSEYLDKEKTIAPYGILVIYNLTDILILTPKKWLHKRIWVLPINISKLTPSQRKQSISIDEADTKNLIRCVVLDARPKKDK